MVIVFGFFHDFSWSSCFADFGLVFLIHLFVLSFRFNIFDFK